MSNTQYIPRFSFEVSEEQKARADKLLGTYGVRKAIMSNVLDSILDLIEEHGQIVSGLLMEKGKPEEILRPLAQAKKRSEDSGRP